MVRLTKTIPTLKREMQFKKTSTQDKIFKSSVPKRDYKKAVGYNLVDKDPMVDMVVAAIKESGLSHSTIARSSGVTTTTLNNWVSGRTMKPQRLTMEFVLRTCGYEMRVVKTSSGRKANFG